MIMFDRRLIKNFGWGIFLIALTFSFIGLINLYSASYQTELSAFKKQLIWSMFGLFVLILISLLDYRLIKRYAFHIYIFSILLLIFVLIMGKEVSGSRSWFSIGQYITIQPSEFVKISIILVLARFYDNDFENGPYGLRDLLKPFILVLIPVALIMFQPDLGTAAIVIMVSASMVFFMGIRTKSIIFLLTLTLGFSAIGWKFILKDYQKKRITTFIDSSQDPLGSGYNAIQSQIAVGSGKLLGKGFKQGSQTQLRFLPAQKTDFAFSVLAEEWGFLGGTASLILYFLIILWILDTASRSKNKFTMLTCFGIATIFFWHIVINVGMVIGLLPVTGVPLLLLSYGGSSTITAMLGIGIVLGIRMRRSPAAKEALELG